MPKKRHATNYSKPQSTVHPSLSSTASSRPPSNNDMPSVNDLIKSFRAQHISEDTQASSSRVQVTTPTLPPSIRHLLALPETPSPKPRNVRRRRRDDNGNLLPAGPAPPRSWLEKSQYAHLPARRPKTDMRPSEVGFLPGLGFQDGGTEEGFPHSLQNTAMRAIARQWEDISQYEKYNLVDLPARLRMMLLSYIAVYGPDEGVGLDGLRHLLIRPTSAEDDEVGQGWGEQVADNDDFFRLDLSRSLGRSIGFKNITSLVTLSDNNAGQAAQSEEAQESWEQEGFLTPNLRPILPHLTHLSLSHPLLSSSSTSWSKLLTFAKHTPTITHLSLACWPVPTMTPHSSTAYISHQGGKDIQFSGTGYYSHSIDGDFTEAAGILRRLTGLWYALVYLDLRGCHAWAPALRWDTGGIVWATRWQSMKTLRLGVGLPIQEVSTVAEVQIYRNALDDIASLHVLLREQRRKGAMIDLLGYDFRPYQAYWKDQGEDGLVKRRLLDLDDRLRSWDRKSKTSASSVGTGSAANTPGEDTVLRNSIWEQ